MLEPTNCDLIFECCIFQCSKTLVCIIKASMKEAILEHNQLKVLFSENLPPDGAHVQNLFFS